MLGADVLIGIATGFVTVTALGTIRACRKLALGFLLGLMAIQFYLEGSEGYQAWVTATVTEFFKHFRFATGLIIGVVIAAVGIGVASRWRRVP